MGLLIALRTIQPKSAGKKSGACSKYWEAGLSIILAVPLCDWLKLHSKEGV